jgi:3-oxoacyl-[acyl-carrier-protein] synthase II
VRVTPVITGLGCVTCFGATVDAFATALISGQTGIAPIERFDTASLHSHCAALVSGYDPAAFIPPLKLRRIDAIGRLALGATRQALDDARLASAPDRAGVGLVLGSFTAGGQTTGEYLERLHQGGPAGAPALLFANTVGNAAASLCGLEFGLHGPNTTISHKEASGLAAMTFAADLVRIGRAPTIVAGGADDLYERFFAVHDWFGVLSRRASAPEGSRPFDATRNGFVFGEGAFFCVIESPEAAARRGAGIYGEIVGIGACGSGERLNHWPSSAAALARAMRAALDDGSCAPGEVGAVYASANSTRQLDAIEAEAIGDVFGRHIPVTSIKGAVGEFGAVGAAAAVAALACGARGWIPPTAGLVAPDPACALDVSSAARALERPLVLVNSFASGGTLYSLLLRTTAARA